jgi:hypothetical protein
LLTGAADKGRRLTIGVDMALKVCPALALGCKKQEPESTGTENPE